MPFRPRTSSFSSDFRSLRLHSQACLLVTNSFRRSKFPFLAVLHRVVIPLLHFSPTVTLSSRSTLLLHGCSPLRAWHALVPIDGSICHASAVFLARRNILAETWTLAYGATRPRPFSSDSVPYDMTHALKFLPQWQYCFLCILPLLPKVDPCVMPPYWWHTRIPLSRDCCFTS